jgi:hypothetical protein
MAGIRPLAAALLAMMMALAVPLAAVAGGSWLEPTGVRVEPGDTLSLSGPVSRGQLGWVEDGPFFAYLSGETTVMITSVSGGGKTDVPLGEIFMEKIDENNMQLSVEVTIPPETPPGEYWVIHCNEPCTSGFGDLFGAQLFVSVDPPPDVANSSETVDQDMSAETRVTTTTTVSLTTTTTEAVEALVLEIDSPSNDADPLQSSAARNLPWAILALAAIGGVGFLAIRNRNNA